MPTGINDRTLAVRALAIPFAAALVLTATFATSDAAAQSMPPQTAPPLMLGAHRDPLLVAPAAFTPLRLGFAF